jgi:outer membrane immunogenic protein
MRNFGIALAAAGAVLTLSAGGAQAQAQNWTGLYGGVHGGVGAGSVQGGSANGGLIGGQVGFNAQADRVVLGVEGDVTSSSFEHKGFNGGGQTFKQKWVGTARGRAGYAFDQVMVYGTGGLATASSQFTDLSGKTTKQAVGWAVGAGAEAQVTQRVSLRGELMHYSLGSGSFSTPVATYKLDQRTNVLRAGVNYRF